MTTTTSYGTWHNHQGHELNIESSVTVALGDYSDDHDVAAIAREWHDAINEALPDGVSLVGNQFIGPADPAECTWEGELDIAEAIEEVDFWAIAERHQLLTLEDIGRDLMKSKAKEPAKAASKTMSRLGVKPTGYRPHPDSGRPQAVFRSADVEAALKGRPGRGTRSDLKAEQG